MRRITLSLLIGFVAIIPVQVARADKLKAARELAELAIKKFGGEAAQEGSERLAARLAEAAARHGDEALDAVRAVGPRALTLADDAGEHAPHVLKLLTRYGDEASAVASDPAALELISRFGDDAAEIMIRHKGIAKPLMEEFGGAAAGALGNLGPQGARRLAMFADSGALAATGKSEEMLAVIQRFGDRAMDFIWKNKAGLAVAAGLAAFLADPEPFLDGTATLGSKAMDGGADIIGSLAEHAVKPLVVTAVPALAQASLPGLRLAFLLVPLSLLGAIASAGFYWREPAIAWLKRQTVRLSSLSTRRAEG